MLKLLAGFLAMLVTGTALAIRPHQSSNTPTVTFSRPVVAIPFPANGTAGAPSQSEPRLLPLPDGRVLLGAQFQRYACSPKSALSYLSCVWVSSDEGKTWSILGGDPDEIADDVDLAEVNGTLVEMYMTNIQVEESTPVTPIYANDQARGTGTTITRSTDGGKTWAETPDVNDQALNDRPFLLNVPGGPLLLVYTAAPGNIYVSSSSDAGATWGLPSLVTDLPPQPGISLDGEPFYDSKRHEVVLTYGYGTYPGLDTQIDSGNIDHIGIARSKDGGKTWTTETAVVLPSTFSNTCCEGEGDLGVLSAAADGAGHEYIVWYQPVLDQAGKPTGAVGVYMARSDTDGNWSPPMRVDPPGGSGFLGEVRAGGDGHIAVAYYGTTSNQGWHSTEPWTVSVATSLDNGAHWSHADVSGSAVYTGPEAGHQSYLYDLTALAIDGSGHLLVAYGDDQGANPPDYKNQIDFARQTTGPTL